MNEDKELPIKIPAKKIKCPRPDCSKSSGGTFQLVGVEREFTVVDENGKVVLHQSNSMYKCLCCGAIFKSDIEPQQKRQLNG